MGIDGCVVCMGIPDKIFGIKKYDPFKDFN